MTDDTETPTVVVGIGLAGVRMLSQFDEMRERRGLDEDLFELLAIDSAEGDIDKEFPELSDQKQLRLNSPDSSKWEAMVESYPYLNKGDEPSAQGGVTRRRPVARALIDDSTNFEIVHNFLEREIESFVEYHGSQPVNLWLLNSLGGGTGSGAFPLLATMLDRIARRVEENYPGVGIDMAGIGTLPQLNLDLEVGRFPEARTKHIINSYNALRELSTLLNHDYSTNLEVKLHAEDNGVYAADYLPLDEPPFEKYFLLPTRESEVASPPARERLNGIVADLIVYFSLTSGIENYPDTEEYDPNEVLFTFNAAELSFPNDLAGEYVQTRETRNAIDNRIRKLERLKDDYKENHQYVQSVYELNRGEQPDEGSPVEGILVRGCRERVRDLLSKDVEYIEEGTIIDGAETAAEELRSEVSARIDQFDVAVETDEGTRTIEEDVPIVGGEDGIDPMNRAIEYLFYGSFEQQLDERIKRNEFATFVEELWREYKRDIQSLTDDARYNELDEGDADTKWEGISNFLDHEVSRLEEDDGWFSFGASDRDAELERKQNELERGDDLQTKRDSRLSLRNAARQRRQAARNDLKDLKRQLEDAAAVADDDINDAELEQGRLDTKLDELSGGGRGTDSLTDYKNQRFAEMALRNPGQLTLEDLEAVDDEWVVDDLVSNGLLSDDDLRSQLSSLLRNQLGERMADKVGRGSGPNGLLAPMLHPRNEGLRGTLEDISAVEGNIEALTAVANIPERLTVRLLATYTPIDLDKTSEYGVIHDYYLRGDTTLTGELMGEDDEDLQRRYVRFAYPELTEDEEDAAEEVGFRFDA